MVVTAHHVRTSLAFFAAAGTVAAALLLHGRPADPIPPPPVNAIADSADDGMQLSANMTSQKLLSGVREQNLAIMVTAPGGRVAVRPPLSLAIVIDRSGSMHGTPMENAKAAAR